MKTLLGGVAQSAMLAVIRHLMRPLLIALALAAVVLLSGCCTHVPVSHRLANCTNSTLRFQMKIPRRDFPPYQFLLALPKTTPSQLSFHGEVVVSQSTGTIAHVPISSDAATPCGWIEGHSSYVLTWGCLNSPTRTSSVLKRGQTYDVEVRFSEQPPPESSLWLSAIWTAGLCF